MKKAIAILGLLLAMGTQASTVTSVVGDHTTWRENGAVDPTFQGGVYFGGTLAFSLLGDAPPNIGDTVTFGSPSVLLSGVQADQLGQMIGWAQVFCAAPDHANERCASAGLGVKEIGLDYSTSWTYDIHAGNFMADSGGVCYFDPNTGFCFPAEGVVNGVISVARNFPVLPVYMTDNRWASLEPLAIAVPEPGTVALLLAGILTVGLVRRIRQPN